MSPSSCIIPHFVCRTGKKTKNKNKQIGSSFVRALLQSVEQLSAALQQFARLLCWWVGGRTCWHPHDNTSKHQHFCSVSHLWFCFFFSVPSSPSDSVAAGLVVNIKSSYRVKTRKVTCRRRSFSSALRAQQESFQTSRQIFYTVRFKRSTSCLAAVGV